MGRSEEILQLVASQDSEYSQRWIDDLMSWLADRDDAELVEILRGSASTLAWRIVGESQVAPSVEVFQTAVVNVATAFKENCKGLTNDGRS